jgi:hypothetical protein
MKVRTEAKAFSAERKSSTGDGSDYPNVLTVQSGFGGFSKATSWKTAVFFNDAGKFDGPYLPLLLKWDRTLNSRFAVGGGINITTGMYRPVK